MTVAELRKWLEQFHDDDLVLETFDGGISECDPRVYGRVLEHSEDLPGHMYDEPEWGHDPSDPYGERWPEGFVIARIKRGAA